MSADPVTMAIITISMTAANMALNASRTFEGPRLDNLDVTTSSYGTPWMRLWGTRRNDGCSIIFAEPIREVKERNKTKGGKYNEYKYYGTFAAGFCQGEIQAVRRIWFDRHLVYDVSGIGPISPFDLGGNLTDHMRLYLGSETQMPDPRMQATIDAREGPGSTPAYRDRAFGMFEELPLEKLGNRYPQVTAELVRNATPSLPFVNIDIPPMTSGINISVSEGVAFTLGPSGWTAVDLVTREIIGTGAEPADSASTAPVEGEAKFYAPGNTGYTLQVVDPIAGTVSTVHAASATDNPGNPLDTTMYVNERFEWVTNLGEGVIVMTRSNGLAYDTLSTLGGATYNSFDYLPDLNDGDPADAIQPVFGFLRDYESDVVYGLFVGDDGRLTPSEIGSYPLLVDQVSGDPIGLAHPWGGGFTPTSYFGKGLSSGKWLIVGQSGTGTRLALFDPIENEFTHTVAADDAGPEISSVVAQLSPLASRVWIGLTEYSLADLSALRTVTLPSGGLGSQYDPINHALIGESSGGDFGWTFLDRITDDGVTLQSIVEEVSGWVGLAPPAIDASSLTQIVPGYSMTQGPAKAALEPLLEYHDVDLRPHGFGLQFLNRGSAPAGTIQTRYMGVRGVGGGDREDGRLRYVITRAQDTDLPRRINITIADPALDQQTNTVPSQRDLAAVDSVRELSIDLSTFVQDYEIVRNVADRIVRRTWFEREAYETSLGTIDIALEPGDVMNLQFDDITRTARLVQMKVGANRVIETVWKRDRQSIAAAGDAAGQGGDGHVPGVIALPVLTKGLFVDTAIVSDAHDGLSLYAGAGPVGDGLWPGADVFGSSDGISYDTQAATFTSTQAAIWGTATTALDDGSPEVWDRANSVTVRMRHGVLTSATAEALLANPLLNLVAVGAEGRYELAQFTTATLVDTDTYTLSGLLRGRRGTEWATGTHQVGDVVVLMDSAVQRVTMGASDVGNVEIFRTVTSGRSTGLNDSLTYSGASMRPYAPVHVRGTRDGSGNLHGTATRRTRVGGRWRDGADVILGETSEAYEVEIMDGATVVRTITGLTSPEFDYGAADQTADFGSPQAAVDIRFYQISPTVGRGYAAEATV